MHAGVWLAANGWLHVPAYGCDWLACWLLASMRLCGAQGMEDWDQETLERAIKEKHAKENNNRATEIICKFFLEAVEKRLYGW